MASCAQQQRRVNAVRLQLTAVDSAQGRQQQQQHQQQPQHLVSASLAATAPCTSGRLTPDDAITQAIATDLRALTAAAASGVVHAGQQPAAVERAASQCNAALALALLSHLTDNGGAQAQPRRRRQRIGTVAATLHLFGVQ